ncbi:hypothetical protein BG0085 [Borreliella bavariensis PBi]|uniref:Uncharacterized protein n=1 Tax=Borrelia garinii subsp. bavariensis (strain ATCC BAA-2496 / DSM 23469 / PBi) TaxID=290434 RepID=A0A7I6GVG6_BORGP|nr:hypothetical protein BG0085 [Borreliella bavariensis PBi]
MPITIERSRAVPSFLIPAGARFINILSLGKLKFEFFIADFTLSLDSLISLPASPTISIPGIPFLMSISISISSPSYPIDECEWIFI